MNIGVKSRELLALKSPTVAPAEGSAVNAGRGRARHGEDPRFCPARSPLRVSCWRTSMQRAATRAPRAWHPALGRFAPMAALVALLVALGWTMAVAPAAATPLSSVSTPSVTLSSPSAGANDVTYSIAFIARSAVATGGTITLVGPPGTVWPGAHDNCSYTLADLTTPSDSFTCSSSVEAAQPGLPIFTFNDPSGSTVTVTVPNVLRAGDHVVLSALGTINPAPGTYSLSVATSADPAPATSAPYAIADASSVTSPAVQVSSPSSAGWVSYTVSFTAVHAIPAGGSITLTGPVGTLWSDGGCPTYELESPPPAVGVSPCSSSVVTNAPGDLVFSFGDRGGATVTLGFPTPIAAGQHVQLLANGVFNPAPGRYHLLVATAADPVPAPTPAYAIVPESSLRALTVKTAPAPKGVVGFNYQVSFTATHALTPGSTVTLEGPPGTLWPPSSSSYTLTDNTDLTGTATAGSLSAAIGGPGNIVTLALPPATSNGYEGVRAGDSLTVAVSGVMGGGGGTKVLQASTSADPLPLPSQPYQLDGPGLASGAVSSPGVQLSTSAAGATGVTATFSFTARHELLAGQGAITVVGPPGFIFGSCPAGCGGGNATYTIADPSHPAADGATSAPSVDEDGASLTVVVKNTIAAGDHVSLTVTQANDPPPGNGTFYLWSSADPTPVPVRASFGPSTELSHASLALSTTTGGANGVTYTMSFTTASALVGEESTVTLAGPPGTIFGSCPYGCGGGNPSFSLQDLTHPKDSGGGGSSDLFIGYGTYVGAGGPMVSFLVNNDIPAGDRVVLSVTQVTNPSAGPGTLQLSTSSDLVPVDLPEHFSPPSAVSATSLKTGPIPAGEVGAVPPGQVYTVGFTTSRQGELLGSLGGITLISPPGTVYALHAPVTVTDKTHPAGSGSTSIGAVAADGRIASLVVPETIYPGDLVTLSVPGVTGLAPPPRVTVGETTSTTAAPVTTTTTVAVPAPAQASVVVVTSSDPALSGGAAGAPTSSIASSLPPLSKGFSPLSSDVVNAGITIGAALFITFPANLFNETFQENYADIAAWRDKWLGALVPSGLRRRLREAARRVKSAALRVLGLAGRSSEKAKQRDWASFAAVVAVGSLLGALLDPGFGANLRTLLSYLAIALAMTAGVALSGLVRGSYHRARKHGHVPYRLEALPFGLVVALACVLISRGSGFQPGYLYGVICGVSFSRELSKHEEGHVVALNSIASVLVALLAWLAWAGVNHFADHQGAFFGAVLADDFLAAMFVSGLVGTVISLFPLRFLPGHKLQSWHRGAWLGTFAISLFVLVELILRPRTGFAGHSHVPLVTTLALFLVFGAGSFAFRQHYANKRKKAEQGQAPVADGEDAEGEKAARSQP